jgi:hypothetical protein
MHKTLAQKLCAGGRPESSAVAFHTFNFFRRQLRARCNSHVARLAGLALAFGTLLFPVRGQSLTTNSFGQVVYTAFDNSIYVLQPWIGRNIAILTQTNQPYNSTVMSSILQALDAAWDYYQSATPAGRAPGVLPSTTLFGRDTISEVNSTCGAGCSYVGYTGTEILPTYFNILYNGVNVSHQFDQVLFYEFGRNFWLYSGQLEYHSPDTDPTVTGFAVYMRFASMDAAHVAGGPFNGFSFQEFRMAVTNLIDSYISNASLNWTNTFRISQAPSNPLGLGGTDLFASLVMRIGRDFGDASFGANFWKQVALRSVANTTQQAVDNFALAGCATVKQNLIGMFTNTWKTPISAAAAQEALQRWGSPVMVHPRLTFSRPDASTLVLRWQSAVLTSYQPQTSPDLITWSDLGSAIAGDGSIKAVVNSISTSSNLFFRLRIN